MTFPLVISFFTKDTPYEKQKDLFIESCKKFDIAYFVQPVPCFGSWEKNCAFKPSFIHHVMKHLKKDVFWLDIDATFVQKPTNSFSDCDIAVRIIPHLDKQDPSKVLSGSIYFRYDIKCLKFLEKWKKSCANALQKSPDMWDQVILRDLLLKTTCPLKISTLPLGFCKIVDWEEEKIKKEDLYILQHQASRLNKKWINKELIDLDPKNILSEP